MIENGRLGNQLFQYAGLKKNFPGERLLLFGFSSLSRAIQVDELTVVAPTRNRVLLALLNKLANLFCSFRIFSKATETRIPEGGYHVHVDSGLFSSVLVVLNSFFYDPSLQPEPVTNVSLRYSDRERAEEYLRRIAGPNPERPSVFVHIRRGDYLSWPTKDEPAVLPTNWYFDAIDDFRRLLDNPFFVLATDDIGYARKLFKGANDIHISNLDELSDLALMSVCQNGILSASSFAWWGAWLSKKHRNLVSDKSIFLAPLYWIGHANGSWRPSGFKTQWLTYKEVNEP